MLDRQPASDESAIEAQEYSDQWLADQVVARRGTTMRFVPAQDRFFVWTGSRWEPDTSLLADNIIAVELRRIADGVARRGATAKQRAKNAKFARAMCSAGKLKAVKSLLENDRAIVVEPNALDQDPWLLNTPAGICDLRTGELGAFDPAQLCTKRTSVAPDFTAACPEWKRFLAEATGGDVEMECYLQRLAGYGLTGVTREQTFTFVWGPGGNGKSVFVNTVRGIHGDYARTAPMDTFTASNNERHSTELAMLQGARLVTASETQAGKRWDEARIKSLTGSDPITARFMRQDFFTYLPQFKLLFTGNHKPELRNIDEAMKRRVHFVPFVVKPVTVDRDLEEKLRVEWPAILAWMIEGCLAWQQQGLNPPEAVRATTDEYFREEDAVGQWLDEACTDSPGAFTPLKELFASWREWCNGLGNAAGTDRRLSQALRNRGLKRGKHSDTRCTGYHDIVLLPHGPEALC